MSLKMRSFTWEKDFELVRTFLILTYNLTHSFQNWIPSMFENIKFGPCGREYQNEEDDYIKIWVDARDSDISSATEMVAVTFCKPSGDCWIQIHPDYRSSEEEIVLWLEKQRKIKSSENIEPELRFRVDETDDKRIALLTKLGYKDSGLKEYNRKRSIDAPIPEYQPPKGFTIRSVNIEQDFVQYKKVQAAVFPHCSNMTKRTARIYSKASFYNKDLDLVAVDSLGNFAAFCTVRMDPVSRIAELEPLGTHPNYRKLGLAKSVICEGLRRLQKHHPSSLCILGAAPSEAANRLYDSVGFTEKTEVHLWQKKL
ncbi:MAG TPA: GNAT family N-acetyltransferase [Candidatus Acidoferrum sp.]|nr:GNAT family N-acetyltransferase [Candidatus Acidoferrum sp.]